MTHNTAKPVYQLLILRKRILLLTLKTPAYLLPFLSPQP